MTRNDPPAEQHDDFAGPVRRSFLDHTGASPVADPGQESLHPRLADRLTDKLNGRDAHENHCFLIKGPARCGKSSLIAQVLSRLPTFRRAVISGPFDSVALVEAVLEALDEASERKQWRSFDLSPPPADELEDFLVDLLDRHCTPDRPLIWVVDPIDALLSSNDSPPKRLKPECFEPVALLFRALERTRGTVYLLAAGRSIFTIPDRGKDCADRLALIDVGLPEPGQARAVISRSLAGIGSEAPDLEPRISRISLGHPRLIDLLTRFAWTMPESLQSALSTLESYLDGRGEVPAEEISEVAAFFESLLLERLLLGLSTPERDLLRLSTSFETPAPLAIVEEFARRFALLEDSVPESGRLSDSRLAKLGLWDFLPLNGKNGEPSLHLVPNPLALERAGTLDDEERPAVAMHLIQLFVDAWLPDDSPPDDARCFQLARLAVHAGDPKILNSVLPAGLRFLQRQLRDRPARHLADQALQLQGNSPSQPTSEVLMAVAELTFRQADFPSGAALLDRARGLTDRDPLLEARFLRSLAAATAARGELDAAVEQLEKAVDIFEDLERPWDAMATLHVLADVHVAREDLRAALDIRERELERADTLKRARRGVTLLGHMGKLHSASGDPEAALERHRTALERSLELQDPALVVAIQSEVARELMEQGRLDESMELQQERLQHFERIGDPAGRAHALWSCARIELRRQRIDAAMGLLVEAYHINLELDQLDGIGLVGLDYGQVLWAAGMMGEARLILERSVGSFRRLGDTRLTQHAESILEELTTAS